MNFGEAEITADTVQSDSIFLEMQGRKDPAFPLYNRLKYFQNSIFKNILKFHIDGAIQ
jgi:hypothetical protein